MNLRKKTKDVGEKKKERSEQSNNKQKRRGNREAQTGMLSSEADKQVMLERRTTTARAGRTDPPD